MIGSSTVALLLLSTPVLYAIQLWIDFRRAVKSVGNLPGFRHLLAQSSILANVIPFFVPGIATGRLQAWKAKYRDFEYFGADIFTNVSIWPRTKIMFNVADAAAIKEITAHRARWIKPIEQYALVLQFGGNIVATEGDEWKKHRKIANPAFSEPNNRLVWDEAVRITMDMIDNVWMNKEIIEMDHAVDITLSIALLIIGSAGFGRMISFAEDLKVPPGYHMSFKDALHIVSQDMIIPTVLPAWMLNLTKRLRNVRTAVQDLSKYMQEMIDERRSAEKKPERHDLFSSLLDANMDEAEGQGSRLADSELIGNIFIFLLAGHETTAHTLCFTLGLLALHPDQQEILYQHIMSVLPGERLPEYEDMGALSYVTAVFHETLRLFPPVATIPKKSAEDTTLVTTNRAGEKIVVPVPKGAGITLHTPGLHYNPKYWKDPSEFRPQRFMEDWPRDAFLPFSGGARSCIGRRFSETEATAILAVLLARYRVEVKDEPRFAHETFEQRKARVLGAKAGITLTPVRVPLVFKRR
ncbi:614/534 cytochrome P450 [Fomitiporia mediterranea MF3/22]|uniref:614/534 cytochrome P450 n=1 Tax=Fomitiporia mediterranea (strain MF3/22) TaxID=694068 RepID=UPI0004408F99|nr:614/534 cytochrome P450 [Fomitiporia mediterranea MF3/22]EJC99158.1 614/534 cytochrome P450 [Fomitiporia mediterranea MF3/22]